MAFNPTFSSDLLWRGEDQERSVTTDLDNIESNIAALQSGKANTTHTHNEYAPSNHSHTEYVSSDDLDPLRSDISGKVDKATGKGLSTNDYTTAEKEKLAGIATGANKYSLPTAGANLGGVKTTSTVTSNSGYTACPIIGGVPYYKDTNTTYTALKNPHALALQLNGVTNKTYDGSSAQTFNVTPTALGEADYVIASGASGAWTYRKWNSGAVEVWRKISGQITHSGTWNGFCVFNGSADWPSGMFVANPAVFYSCYIGTGYAIASRGGLSTTTQFRWSALGTDNDPNVGYCVDVYAIGRWK